MGLDQYVYLVKNTKNFAEMFNGITEEQARNIGCIVFEIKDIDKGIEESIKDYCCVSSIALKKYDEELVRKENNIPESYRLWRMEPGKDGGYLETAYSDNGSTDEIVISFRTKEDYDKYYYDEMCDCYVMLVIDSEIFYQRKNWDMHEELVEVVGHAIENCSYLALNDDCIEVINSYMVNEGTMPLGELANEFMYVYHPWW